MRRADTPAITGFSDLRYGLSYVYAGLECQAIGVLVTALPTNLDTCHLTTVQLIVEQMVFCYNLDLVSGSFELDAKLCTEKGAALAPKPL